MRSSSFFAIIVASFALWLPSTYAHSVKIGVNGAQLWKAPDPADFSRPIGKLRSLEEVEVLQTITDRHFRKWFKIRSRQSPGWKRRDVIGWVTDGQATNTATDRAMITEATSTEVCTTCADDSNESENLKSMQQTGEAISNYSTSKGSFVWPANGAIRSNFGMRRHPILGIVKLHDGIDIAAPNKSPVQASKAGTVVNSQNGCSDVSKSCNGGSGNFITIDHTDGTKSKYLHLSSSCQIPEPGSYVQQGEKIACVGSSGASTGPHLHFSLTIEGTLVNPLQMLPRSSL